MNDTLELVDTIAETLGETQPVPCAQIRRIVKTLGPERAQAFVDQAMLVEAAGGMMLPDGSRRRTPGGTFFFLVREGVSEEERLAIFPPRRPKPKQKGSATSSHDASRSKPSGGAQQREDQPTHEQPKPMKISQFWLDLAAGKPLGPKWPK
jgi:hypothetical protein